MSADNGHDDVNDICRSPVNMVWWRSSQGAADSTRTQPASRRFHAHMTF